MNAVRAKVWRRAGPRVHEPTGAPTRTRVILLLAGVLALGTADAASVGAVAVELERSLHLSNTDVGLMVTLSVGIGAIATLPVGILVDRANRSRLLWISVLLWALAMVVSGLATSYVMLLLTRFALGAVIAAAYPATASLTGDLFPPAERGQVYGYILAGELVGTGVGFLVSGDLAAALSWRAGFLWLAVPSLALAWMIRRHLPEPARGGQRRLEAGKTGHRSTEAVGEAGGGEVGAKVEERHVAPHEGLVLREDPTGRSLWWAVRYTLSIRTNLILIIASGLGYFFLQGLQTFAVIYLRGRYGLSQFAASTLLVALGTGAILGVLITGRLSDRLIHRGWITARPVVAAAAFGISAALFVPGLLLGSLAIVAPLLFLAAAGLGGTNPPLNAARLDLLHSRLWGRAESVRTALSTVLQAVAPLVFGYVSTLFGGHSTGLAERAPLRISAEAGLEPTFLIMLIPLAGAALLLVRARSTYPRDVATAVASEHALRPDAEPATG